MSDFNAMNDWIQRYIEYGFPIIPLGRKSKCPVVRGWEKDRFPAAAFRGGNVGARAGERVNVDGKEGHLLIIDFDSPDLDVLRQLCSDVPLARTTCVRTGGEHDGYHLFYLTAVETRKRGLLSYRGASVDLLGKGSFAVVPPSVVNKPYRYLVGLEEIAFLSNELYGTLVATLEAWKKVNVLIKHLAAGKLTRDKASEKLSDQDPTPEMVAHFTDSIASVESD
ncbi:MAG: bifunctional DNA primase/polymerase [Lentisphaerae bacterium]|nr:bifunctional DNA primase/polymerase [Lentisphaerota bacterium]